MTHKKWISLGFICGVSVSIFFYLTLASDPTKLHWYTLVWPPAEIAYRKAQIAELEEMHRIEQLKEDVPMDQKKERKATPVRTSSGYGSVGECMEARSDPGDLAAVLSDILESKPGEDRLYKKLKEKYGC